MKMRKIALKINCLLIALSLFVACNNNKIQQLTSPDGKTVLTFSLFHGRPYYAVQKNHKEIIKPSRLGFLLSSMDSLCSGFKVTSVLRLRSTKHGNKHGVKKLMYAIITMN